MTDIPNYQTMVEFASASLRGAKRYSKAYQAGRGRTAAANVSAILPHVVEWPYTTDANGQSYPAGTVGVRLDYTHTTADPTTFNNSRLIGVPGELPVGYTARWERTHNEGAWGFSSGDSTPMAWAFGGGSLLPSPNSTPPYPWYRRTSDELIRIASLDPGATWSGGSWMPENVGGTCYGIAATDMAFFRTTRFGNAFAPSLDVDPTNWFSAPCTGMRYHRMRYQNLGIPGTDAGRVELVCNADGSNTQPGDTVVQTLSWGSGVGTFDTGYSAQIESPIGMPVYYGYRIFYTLLSGGAYNHYGYSDGYVNMGPRMDIPFPFTCYGEDTGGSLIVAPGGYVP